MTDTSEVQLAKLEAEHKRRIDALKEVETQLTAIRAANRDAKLVELKKQAIRKSWLKRDQSCPASIMRMSVEMSAP